MARGNRGPDDEADATRGTRLLRSSNIELHPLEPSVGQKINAWASKPRDNMQSSMWQQTALPDPFLLARPARPNLLERLTNWKINRIHKSQMQRAHFAAMHDHYRENLGLPPLNPMAPVANAAVWENKEPAPVADVFLAEEKRLLDLRDNVTETSTPDQTAPIQTAPIQTHDEQPTEPLPVVHTEQDISQSQESVPETVATGLAVLDEIPAPKNSGDKKRWDEMAYWVGEFQEWDLYEKYSKAEMEETLLRNQNMVAAALAGDPDWQRAAQHALSWHGNGLGREARTGFMRYLQEHPDEAKSMIAVLANPTRSVEERIDEFCRVAQGKVVGDSNFSADPVVVKDSGLIAIASNVMYAIHGDSTPPYRPKMFQDTYKMTGYEKPARSLSAGKTYLHGLGMLDSYVSNMQERDLGVRTRKDAYSSMLWTVSGDSWFTDKKHGNALPSHFDEAKARRYFDFLERNRGGLRGGADTALQKALTVTRKRRKI